MIIKAVTFFLIGLLVLGMFGKLRIPKKKSRKTRRRIETAKKCPHCGNYVLGDGSCSCRKSQ